METALLRSVGPIAKILMARISPQCSTVSELRDRLAAQITDEKDRTMFLRQVGGDAQAGASPTPSAVRAAAEVTQWDPVVLANAKQHLAVYAGPIASVIVDRAHRQKAGNAQELYQMLAAEIQSEADRAGFFSGVRRWGDRIVGNWNLHLSRLRSRQYGVEV